MVTRRGTVRTQRDGMAEWHVIFFRKLLKVPHVTGHRKDHTALKKKLHAPRDGTAAGRHGGAARAHLTSSKND